MKIKNFFRLTILSFLLLALTTVGTSQTSGVQGQFNSINYGNGTIVVENSGFGAPNSSCSGLTRYTQLNSTPPGAIWECVSGTMVNTTFNPTVPGSIGFGTPSPAQFTILNVPDNAINVRAAPYNAVGDCSTDDHDAILAALTAAYSVTPRRALFFPRPPGGCYLTSTLPWFSISMYGVPSGIGNQTNHHIVKIQGKPGQDIFNYADPNTTNNTTPLNGYTVQDLEFIVDDSVDVSSSHPNRKLGRTIVDAAMTAGGYVLTSPAQAAFTKGDVGQQVFVGSVKSGGLLSTIVSYQSATQVTLADNATITASGASAYISIGGILANASVGNCAFAVDNYDGNPANWLGNPSNNMNNNSIWNNVLIYGLAGPRNNTCGIFYQPMGMPYNQVWNNSMINFLPYGFLSVPYTVNPGMGNGVGADYFQWYGGYLGGTFPFIMYNGGDNRIDQVQICSTNKPEVLATYSASETYPGDWYVHIPEDECQTGAGWRLEGKDHHFVQTELGGLASGSTFPVLWDATNSSCTECDVSGPLQINGNANRLEFLERADSYTLADNGFDNRIVTAEISNLYTNRRWMKIISKEETLGAKKGDFIQHGLGNFPYNNDNDMWLWPSDFGIPYGNYGPIVKDTTSDSGQYLPLGVNYPYGGGGFGLNANFLLVNGNTSVNPNYPVTQSTVWPASKLMVYIKGKCPTTQTVTGTIYAILLPSQSQTAVGYISGSCSSSYSVIAAVPVDFTSYAGGSVSFNFSITSEFDIAWIGARPWNFDLLVNGPIQQTSVSGGYILTEGQPTLTANRTILDPDGSGTRLVSGVNSAAVAINPTQYDLCGSLNGTSVTCNYNPQAITYPPNGTILSGSTVTFNWTPAVGSSNYYVHLGLTPGGTDYANATAVNSTSYTVYNIPTTGTTVYLEVVPVTGIGGKATATYTEASSALLAGYDVQVNTASPLTFKNSPCDHGVTTAGVMTCSDAGGITAVSFQTTGGGADTFAAIADPGSPVNGNDWYSSTTAYRRKFYANSTTQTYAWLSDLIPTTTVSSGTISQINANQYVICTTTCTVTPLAPIAGQQLCVRNGPGVSTVITLAALGSGNYYELTSHASWGTANHTVVSGGAATDSICLVGYDANHYAVFSYNGTWTD